MTSASEVIKTLKAAPEVTRCEAEICQTLLCEIDGVRLYSVDWATPIANVDRSRPPTNKCVGFTTYRISENAAPDYDEYVEDSKDARHAFVCRILEQAISRLDDHPRVSYAEEKTCRLLEKLMKAIHESYPKE